MPGLRVTLSLPNAALTVILTAMCTQNTKKLTSYTARAKWLEDFKITHLLDNKHLEEISSLISQKRAHCAKISYYNELPKITRMKYNKFRKATSPPLTLGRHRKAINLKNAAFHKNLSTSGACNEVLEVDNLNIKKKSKDKIISLSSNKDENDSDDHETKSKTETHSRKK